MKPFYGKTKPSELLQAMVDGLRSARPQLGRYVNMETFGRVDKLGAAPVCFGCAATWALETLLPKGMTPDRVALVGSAMTRRSEVRRPTRANDVRVLMSEAVGSLLTEEEAERVCKFESAMDVARLGILHELEEFCELPAMVLGPWEDRWSLRTGTYLDELPVVELAVAEMKETGL